MASQKNRRRNQRSAKTRCKPVKYPTEEAAKEALDRIYAEHPLQAMGQVVYWCISCKKYHTGRLGHRKT